MNTAENNAMRQILKMEMDLIQSLTDPNVSRSKDVRNMARLRINILEDELDALKNTRSTHAEKMAA